MGCLFWGVDEQGFGWFWVKVDRGFGVFDVAVLLTAFCGFKGLGCL